MTEPQRILVIDDNADNQKLVAYLLTRCGYEIRTAADAEIALTVLETWHPHLILIDLQLPGMDGFDLTRALRANSHTRDIVIVALTAYAMKGDEERAIAAGCDDYIAKPIDTRTLPHQIAAHLHRKLEA
jgi:CheY-like chemotaxis protein